MIETWITYLRVNRGMLPNTLRAYRRELEYLSRHWADGKPETLSTGDLRDYIVERGGQAGTINKRISALASFYRFLVRIEARLDDPTLRLDRPKARRGLPRPVSDLAVLQAAMDEHTRLISILLSETGLRISEACSLNVPSPVPDVLLVRGKGDKERRLPLTLEARAALDELGGRIGIKPRAVQRRFQRFGFTPHQMRHTFASGLAEAGADLGDIQKLLGHSSPATTQVYAHFSTERLRRALELRKPLAS